jgi:hypothetical protein
MPTKVRTEDPHTYFPSTLVYEGAIHCSYAMGKEEVLTESFSK